MKERPILFSAPMVRAILQGRKTQTRRVFKYPGMPTDPDFKARAITQDVLGDWVAWFTESNSFPSNFNWKEWTDQCYPNGGGIKCPYGKPGDRLWVRETWQATDWIHPSNEEWGYIYRADTENAEAWESSDPDWKWRPSIHMPRAASRILLEVVNVRVERLQEISEQAAIEEGIERSGDLLSEELWFKNYLDPNWLVPARHSFSSLWESIYGPESWESNPWVWVIEFKRINP